jgi:hypothetical protein
LYFCGRRLLAQKLLLKTLVKLTPGGSIGDRYVL